MDNRRNHSIIQSIQFNYDRIPLAVFLVGANGSGKSTLRNYLNLTDIQTNIDPDVLNRLYQQKYPANYLNHAARQALTMLYQALQDGVNICLETTLSGKGSMQRIICAKERGYFLIAYFVGLNNVELNIARIKHRVSMGGHDIQDEIVKRRYFESIENFKCISSCFNEVHLIDNSSDGYRLQVSRYHDNRQIQHSKVLEPWISKFNN